MTVTLQKQCKLTFGEFSMKKFLLIAVMMFFSSVVMAESYTAVISCGMNGQNYTVAACFTDTELKITKNNASKVYKVYQLSSVGTTRQDGLHIDLPYDFEIRAQNSHATLVLGVTITNSSGDVVFSDEAGKWGRIRVGN